MDVPDYVLEGERVALGPLRKDLADRYRRWPDLEVRNGSPPLAFALEPRRRVDSDRQCAGAQPEMANFTIYDLPSAPVGTSPDHDRLALEPRDVRHHGERRGTGLGTETTR
jgi:hypothetical protein